MRARRTTRAAWHEARSAVVVLALVSTLLLLALQGRAFLGNRLALVRLEVALAERVPAEAVSFELAAGRLRPIVGGQPRPPLAAARLFEGLLPALLPTAIGALAFAGLLLLLRDSRLSEGALRRLLDATPFPLAVLDPFTHAALSINRAAVQFLGSAHRGAAEQAVGRLIEAHAALAQRCAPQAPADAAVTALELPVPAAGGVPRQALVSVGRTTLADREVVILGFADIDQQHRAELALREAVRASEAASQAKTEFLSVASHELRTPLQALVGLLAQLDAAPPPAVAQRIGQRLQQAAQTMAMLLDDMLDFVLVRERGVRLEARPFDWREAVGGAATLASAAAAARHAARVVRVACEGDAACDPVGDAGRIRQVVANLVGNAIKHACDGAVDVRARLQRLPGEPGVGELDIVVEDEGPGLPPAVLERPFEPYAAAGPTAGMGLGLAISRRLADAMGASLTLENLAPRGARARFRVRLPLVNPQVAARATALGVPARRVLLVEDMETNRRIAAALLRDAGHDVIEAATLAEAVRAVRAAPAPHLVLCDLRLPDGDGRALLPALPARFAPGGPEFVLAMTANPVRLQQASLRLAGFDHVVAKPFDLRALDGLLDELVEHREAARRALAASEARLADLQARLADDAERAMTAFVALVIEARTALAEQVARLVAPDAGAQACAQAAVQLEARWHRLAGAAATLGLAPAVAAGEALVEAAERQPGTPEAVSAAALGLAEALDAACRLVQARLAGGARAAHGAKL